MATDASENGHRFVFWCKDRSGVIYEHVTTPHEGHKGHVHCVQIKEWTDGVCRLSENGKRTEEVERV